MTSNKTYIFIDESGDSSFYGKRKKLLVGREGFQPMLNLGMITFTDKKNIRAAVVEFMDRIKADPLYNTIASVSKSNWYLHAKDDHPEVRAKFFEFIRKLEGFKAFFVIGRKRLSTFQNKHNNNESEFYFDLVYHLLKDRLNKEDERYHIFLAARKGSNQKHLRDAITKAIQRDNKIRKIPKSIQYQYDIVRSVDTPELCVVDYMLWALNRYIINGEARFYEALKSKYSLIIDLYDTEKYQQPDSNYYNQKTLFDLKAAGQFRNDGYL